MDKIRESLRTFQIFVKNNNLRVRFDVLCEDEGFVLFFDPRDRIKCYSVGVDLKNGRHYAHEYDFDSLTSKTLYS